MGESTFVRTRTARASSLRQLGSLRLGLDVPLVGAVAALLVFGALMVYSSGWQYSIVHGLETNELILKQVVYAVVGSLIALAVSYFDYHRYQRWILPVMFLTLTALFVVLLVPNEGVSTKRSFLNGSIQPSEPAKLAVLLYLSVWLYSKREFLNHITFGLIPLSTILGLVGGFILLQPDISAALTIFLLGGMLFFLAGGDWKQIILVVLIAAGLGVLMVQFSDTAQVRITEYINGLNNPINASTHVKWSMQAVVNGGIFGVGIGRSTAKFAGLPVAPTDSIFAVIAEETGLVGSVVVIGLYLVILWRGLAIANRAPDLLGKLMASGITFWIIIEALINMGVLVNLLPFAGNALPLISAGGSSLLVTLAGLGVVLNVARVSSQKTASGEGRSFGAVVDLRRRDGRGRVPRANRFTGTR